MESLEEELLEETLEDREEEHLSDTLVTQTILCVGVVTAVFVLNVFKPQASAYLLDTFKYYTSVELSQTLRAVLMWLYGLL